MKNISTTESLWVGFAFICILIIIIGFQKYLNKMSWNATKKQYTLLKFLAAIIIWLSVLIFFSRTGFFSDFTSFPPKLVLAIFIPSILVLIFSLSEMGTELLKTIPPSSIVLMQSFRIVVELLILQTYLDNKFPIQMTFEGKNMDIFSGIIAIPVGYYLMSSTNKHKQLLLFYNIIGLGLLINIIIVSVLSLPTPYRYFMSEPSNSIIGNYPYVLLPGVLVLIAISMHIFSLRQWWLLKHAEHSTERSNFNL